MSDNHFQVTIAVRKYCRLLAATAISLVFIHLALAYYNYRIEEVPWLIVQLFHLDEENNIPTWFSSFLLLNVAAVLYLAALSKEGKYRIHWFLIAAGFLILAMDEVAGLHESFNSAIEMNWAIPGAILITIVGLIFVPFLLSLERRLAGLFLLSGFLFVSGAIIVELLSQDMDEETLAYNVAVALEEGLEMLGALFFLLVNLKEMQNNGEIKINVGVS